MPRPAAAPTWDRAGDVVVCSEQHFEAGEVALEGMATDHHAAQKQFWADGEALDGVRIAYGSPELNG